MRCQGKPNAGSVQNSYKKIMTSTSTVQIICFLKVEKKMGSSNIHVLMFALNRFTPRRNKYIKLFSLTILQCHVGRYRELKKRKPARVYSLDITPNFQDKFRFWSGRARTGYALFHRNNS